MKVLAKDLRYRQWFLHDGRKCEAAGMLNKSGECLHLSEGAIAWINENCEVELIDPPAEPTYAELQAEWCNDHGVVAGSRVKVTRRAKEGEQGWPAVWMGAMDRYVGASGLIEEIGEHSGLVINDWIFPYFVLEPVKSEPAIDPGPGWRLLEDDEIATHGTDDLLDYDNEWHGVAVMDGVSVGSIKRGGDYKAVRRRLAPAVKPSVGDELLARLDRTVEALDDPTSRVSKEVQAIKNRREYVQMFFPPRSQMTVSHPDMALAYASLAPLVAKAIAYYECGSDEKGLDALKRAENVIIGFSRSSV